MKTRLSVALCFFLLAATLGYIGVRQMMDPAFWAFVKMQINAGLSMAVTVFALIFAWLGIEVLKKRGD